MLFTPFAGTSFATLKFTTETGGNCPAETKVTGKVAGQVFTDPSTPPTLGTLVTLERGVTEKTSWLVNFPATQPKKVVKINEGTVKEEANPGLTAFSEEAIEEGTALILLAKREANGELVSEETEWSPLAPTAPAVEAPRWSIGGTDLVEGKTHFITAKAYSTSLKLRTGNVTVSCTTLKLKEGSLRGSKSAGSAGKNNEVIVFEGCTVSGTAGGKPIEKCKVNEPIETTALTSELVESEGAKPGEKKRVALGVIRTVQRRIIRYPQIHYRSRW